MRVTLLSEMQSHVQDCISRNIPANLDKFMANKGARNMIDFVYSNAGRPLKIGIYGSSFDPITFAHIFTAATVRQRMKLDAIIFLPCSNFRSDKPLKTPGLHRLAMVLEAIKPNPHFVVDDHELKSLPGEDCTYKTLEHFRNIKYKGHELFFIMGADLIKNLDQWHYAEKLISEFKFIVMERNGYNMLEDVADSVLIDNNYSNFTFMNKGFAMDISSTYIRKQLAKGGAVDGLLPDKCVEHAMKYKLYEY